MNGHAQSFDTSRPSVEKNKLDSQNRTSSSPLFLTLLSMWSGSSEARKAHLDAAKALVAKAENDFHKVSLFWTLLLSRSGDSRPLRVRVRVRLSRSGDSRLRAF